MDVAGGRRAEIDQRVVVKIADDVYLPTGVGGHCDVVVAVPTGPSVELLVAPWAAVACARRHCELPLRIVIGNENLAAGHFERKPNRVTGPYPVDGQQLVSPMF